MRGIPSLITEIRKRVFTEVARMAYSGDYTDMEDIPFKIVPGQSPLHRESVFLERAIAGERVRLAMGLSLQPVQTRTLLTEGMDQAAIAEQYYEPPLVNIIPYACHACPVPRQRAVSGLPRLLVPARVPEGRDQICQRQEPHRPEALHQVRQMRQILSVQRHHLPRAPVSGRLRHGRHRRRRIRQGLHRL